MMHVIMALRRGMSQTCETPISSIEFSRLNGKNLNQPLVQEMNMLGLIHCKLRC